MLMTKRKPASVGEILAEEFMGPLGLTQGDLAEAMGVPRKQRTVQRPARDNRRYRHDAGACLRQQCRFLAERAAPLRPVGGVAFSGASSAHRARQARAFGCVKPDGDSP
jgi:hypothetical protein